MRSLFIFAGFGLTALVNATPQNKQGGLVGFCQVGGLWSLTGPVACVRSAMLSDSEQDPTYISTVVTDTTMYASYD